MYPLEKTGDSFPHCLSAVGLYMHTWICTSIYLSVDMRVVLRFLI